MKICTIVRRIMTKGGQLLFVDYHNLWPSHLVVIPSSELDSKSATRKMRQDDMMIFFCSINIYASVTFCSGGGLLSVKECFQWDRVPSILPMRTKSQGNEVILSTYYHSNLIRTTPLLIEFYLSKFKTKNQSS